MAAVAGFEGVVEGVTVRETLLRTFDGRRVLIPNAKVYTNPLEVQTHFPLARSAFTVAIAPGGDLDRARSVAGAALGSVAGIAAEPPPEAVVLRWTSDAVELECRFWSGSHSRDRTAATDGAVRAVHDAYLAERIALPAEHLTVDLAGERPDARD